MKLRALIFLLVTFLPVSASAQTPQSVCSRIEHSVTDLVSGWTLRKSRNLTDCKHLALFEWESSKTVVSALVFIEKSVADAQGALETMSETFDIGAGVQLTLLDAKVANLGDDNQMWVSERGNTGVDVRKGKVVVHVSAMTMELAKQFAQIIADGLPAA
jgi:hypothetical protein